MQQFSFLVGGRKTTKRVSRHRYSDLIMLWQPVIAGVRVCVSGRQPRASLITTVGLYNLGWWTQHLVRR
jgi:hypothetical protein